MKPAVPGRIYIVSSHAGWQAAQAAGDLRTPALEAEGFIHAASAEQVPGVLARHFAGQSGLCLLEIDPVAVAGALRLEQSPRSGEWFPHIYSSVPLAAVLSAEPIP